MSASNSSVRPSLKVDLSRSRALIVDDSPDHRGLISRILSSFGLNRQEKRDSLASAKEAIYLQEFDLMLVEAAINGADGFEFVRWLRRFAPEPNRYCPVLMVTSATQRDRVAEARDAGANFVMAKPVTPGVLMERIVWVGKDQRHFVETNSYAGPDRRFQHFGPPVGTKGRRKDDLAPEIGAASEPNMSQGQIDMLIKPMKVNL